MKTRWIIESRTILSAALWMAAILPASPADPVHAPLDVSFSPDQALLAAVDLTTTCFTGDLIWLDTRDAHPQATTLGPESEPGLVQYLPSL